MPPGLKELMLFYVPDYHFITNAFRKTHYHKIEKSHQIPPPCEESFQTGAILMLIGGNYCVPAVCAGD